MTGAPQPRHSEHGAPHERAEALLGTVGVVRRLVNAAETVTANRRWWDADAEDYLAAHGASWAWLTSCGARRGFASRKLGISATRLRQVERAKRAAEPAESGVQRYPSSPGQAVV